MQLRGLTCLSPLTAWVRPVLHFAPVFQSVSNGGTDPFLGSWYGRGGTEGSWSEAMESSCSSWWKLAHEVRKHFAKFDQEPYQMA